MRAADVTEFPCRIRSDRWHAGGFTARTGCRRGVDHHPTTPNDARGVDRSTPMTTPAIEASGLVKRYSTKTALGGIDIVLRER